MPSPKNKSALIVPVKSGRGGGSDKSIIETVLATTPARERVQLRPFPPQPTENQTIPERIVAIMGTRTMSAKEVGDALLNSGFRSQSADFAAQMASTLAASKVRVKGSDGFPIRHHNDAIVMVCLFKRVSRGQYRVATRREQLKEANELLAAGLSSEPKGPKRAYTKAAPKKVDSDEVSRDSLRGMVRKSLRREDVKAVLQEEVDALVQEMLDERRL